MHIVYTAHYRLGVRLDLMTHIFITPPLTQIYTFIFMHMNTALVTVDDAEKGTELGEVVRYDFFGEPIIVLEIKCKRYACSAADTAWKLYPVSAVPSNFLDFLGEPTTRDNSSTSRAMMRAIFGENNMQLPRTSVWEILVRQMVHPFYLFQYFSVAVW
jgi:hypothetical protein